MEDIMLGIFEAVIGSQKIEDGKLLSLLMKKFHEGEELYETESMLAMAGLTEFLAEPFKKTYCVAETNPRKLAVIPHLYDGLLEAFLTKKIAKEEGGMFSGDKAGFVVSSIKKALISGKNIPLEVHYEDLEDETCHGRTGRCFWSPSSFADTDHAIEQFMVWYCMENI